MVNSDLIIGTFRQNGGCGGFKWITIYSHNPCKRLSLPPGGHSQGNDMKGDVHEILL